MKLFLLLEGSEQASSAALADVEKGELLAELSAGVQSDHLYQLADQLLQETGFSKEAIKGVAVNAGPGSYTGLRIVASFAKGICAGLDIPLYGISGLRALAHEYYLRNPEFTGLVVCLLDARREEVFAAAYHHEKIVLRPSPKILNVDFFHDFDSFDDYVIIGSGAEKSKPYFGHDRVKFDTSIQATASSLLLELLQKIRLEEQVNIATFEPDYLKAFYFSSLSKE
jgi:tRNA threonylcarbamoyladenosine biosynthesis protein TsaB